ncbi:unnamed protein product [Caenorhabditis nigoni]
MLLGFGYALYYQGNGGYMTSHSTRKTIESNVNIAWSIGCVCFLISSGIFAGVTRMTHAPSQKQTCTALVDRNMLELFFLFSVIGTSTSFWLSIFPTAMNFTVANSGMTYLCAIYPLGIGIGEIFMALFITQMSRRHKDFSLQPVMIMGTVFAILPFIMVHVSTPYDSPQKPTREDALLFGHSYFLIFIIGLTLGIGDCCLNSCRSVICALAMSDRRAQAFSISKLYQALGSCILFFLSPIIPLYVYTIGISVHLIIAMIFFLITARRTQNMEKKNYEGKKEEI